MIRTILGWLSNSLQSTPALALAGSFTWGILSILLSPCHLASIPLIVGFIDSQGRISTKRAFVIAALFSLGILITIALIGLITGLAGRMLGDIGTYGNYVVAAIFFAIGLHFMEVITLSFPGKTAQPKFRRKGALAGFMLGLLFGIALGPCTFAYMAPMVAITFKIAATQLIYGAVLLAVYGAGHCSVIALAGTFTEVVQHYLNWNEKSRGAIVLKKVCGLLVILGGIYLIWCA